MTQLTIQVLPYFFLLAGFSFLLFLPQSWPAKWLHLRKRAFFIFFGGWLVTVGFLLAGFLQTAPFIRAVKSGNVEQAKELLSKKSSLIQARTVLEHDTALHLAAITGNNEMAVLLLKTGADVNATDSSDITPLHETAFYGNDLVAETLLKAGADVNAIGYRDNVTPLGVAVVHGHLNVIKILLAHGANPSIADRFGKTPLRCAQDEHLTNIVAVLSNPPPKSKN